MIHISEDMLQAHSYPVVLKTQVHTSNLVGNQAPAVVLYLRSSICQAWGIELATPQRLQTHSFQERRHKEGTRHRNPQTAHPGCIER